MLAFLGAAAEDRGCLAYPSALWRRPGSEGSRACRLGASQVNVGVRHYTWCDVMALLSDGSYVEADVDADDAVLAGVDAAGAEVAGAKGARGAEDAGAEGAGVVGGADVDLARMTWLMGNFPRRRRG